MPSPAVPTIKMLLVPRRTIGSGGARFIRGDNGDAAALAANGELGVPDGRLALLLRVLWLEDGATCELC